MRRACLALTAALALIASADRAASLELEGTWYVLVHYKDANTPNADSERWEDRVWVFERQGGNLRWTEYPIVVFDDESGRFERRDSGQYARVLHFWEPDAAQQTDIRDGLQVNTRGSKTKTLRGSDTGGWSSGRRAGAASASVVTYQEVWSIDGMPLPVFTRSDFMGGGRTDTLEGLTEFATTKAEEGVLSGTFQRDGSRRGVFRMLPAGATGAVEGAESQRELQQKMIERETQRQLMRQASNPSGAGDDGEWLPRGASGEDLEALRSKGATPSLPLPGMRVGEVVAALRAPPGAVNQKATLLRKLEVLRLRPDGFELVPEEQVESGAFQPKPGESYGVVALAFCDSGIGGQNDHTSWYLLPDGALAAWDHYETRDECVYSNHFQPASGDGVALERVLVAQREKTFPPNLQADTFLYAQGIQLARVGRVDDAKAKLVAGDENLTLGVDGAKQEHTSNRSRLVTRDTDAAVREALVRAIEVAAKATAAPTKTP